MPDTAVPVDATVVSGDGGAPGDAGTPDLTSQPALDSPGFLPDLAAPTIDAAGDMASQDQAVPSADVGMPTGDLASAEMPAPGGDIAMPSVDGAVDQAMPSIDATHGGDALVLPSDAAGPLMPDLRMPDLATPDLATADLAGGAQICICDDPNSLIDNCILSL